MLAELLNNPEMQSIAYGVEAGVFSGQDKVVSHHDKDFEAWKAELGDAPESMNSAVAPELAEKLGSLPVAQTLELTDTTTHELLKDKLVHELSGTSDAKQALEQLEMAAYELRDLSLEELRDVLVRAGVVSLETLDKHLGRFSDDRLVQRKLSQGGPVWKGGFRHIFIGDADGGLHDHDTIEDLENAGVLLDEHDTRLVSTDEGGRRRAKQPYVPEILQPDIRVGISSDFNGDGEPDAVKLTERHASSQFPEAWTMDETIDRVVSVADSAGQDNGGGNLIHTGEFSVIVDGQLIEAKLLVYTDKSTGKIVGAHPEYSAVKQPAAV